MKINCQMKPKIKPPIKFGIKKIVLKKEFDLIFRVTSMAKPSPIKFIKKLVMLEHLSVNQIETKKINQKKKFNLIFRVTSMAKPSTIKLSKKIVMTENLSVNQIESKKRVSLSKFL